MTRAEERERQRQRERLMFSLGSGLVAGLFMVAAVIAKKYFGIELDVP